MPCYDERNSPSYIHENEIKPLEKQVKELIKRNNELTDMLCSVGRAIYGKTELKIEVINWWSEHKKFDEDRGDPWPEEIN